MSSVACFGKSQFAVGCSCKCNRNQQDDVWWRLFQSESQFALYTLWIRALSTSVHRTMFKGEVRHPIYFQGDRQASAAAWRRGAIHYNALQLQNIADSWPAELAPTIFMCRCQMCAASCFPDVSGQEWRLGIGISSSGTISSLGQSAFDERFKASRFQIIRRTCPSCDASFQDVYYRRPDRLSDTETRVGLCWYRWWRKSRTTCWHPWQHLATPNFNIEVCAWTWKLWMAEVLHEPPCYSNLEIKGS